MLPSLKWNFVLVFVVYLRTVNSQCRQSYITICDTFEDFRNLNDTENVSDMMIGSEDGHTNMTTVDLMKTLQLNKFHKLTTLMIVRAINQLEITEEAYECRYEDLSLQHLILYGNILKTVGPYHFPITDPLKRLSLVNNQIESLQEYAFVNYDIENLDLSDNLLELIVGSSFPLRRSTKVITLKNNRLTHIEPESFPETLETLHLDKNKLRYIQDEVLQPLINLKVFTLSHNNLNNLPKVKHMKQLVSFDISNNAISTIKKDTFKNMKNLKFVDLSNNRITDAMIFKWIYTPQKQPHLTVSLAFNRLKELNVDGVVLQNQTFVLYGNPWDCDKWRDLKIKLGGQESECDKKISASNEVPYCINYNTDDIAAGDIPAGMFEPYIDRMHNTIKNNVKAAGCVLQEKKYEFLFPKFYVCLA
ncbi:hypothetical protein Zmor_011421 [Zophobas morio]|uniref:Leucine-rich repeat-containing protein 15 n=1 Tax=Zophobas morio TaxID=2755281 RepID=A0AA38IQS9_9CUCU|nr:hypothetical protein Zmor_011421 [Zophobas morio]